MRLPKNTAAAWIAWVLFTVGLVNCPAAFGEIPVAPIRGPDSDPDPTTLEGFVQKVHEMKAAGCSSQQLAAYVAGVTDRRLTNPNTPVGEMFMGLAGISSSVRRYFTEVDSYKAASVVDAAKWSWNIGVGECGYHAAIAHYVLRSAGVPVRQMRTGKHEFVVVGMDPRKFNAHDTSTWGPNAYIVDGWRGAHTAEVPAVQWIKDYNNRSPLSPLDYLWYSGTEYWGTPEGNEREDVTDRVGYPDDTPQPAAPPAPKAKPTPTQAPVQTSQAAPPAPTSDQPPVDPNNPFGLPPGVILTAKKPKPTKDAETFDPPKQDASQRTEPPKETSTEDGPKDPPTGEEKTDGRATDTAPPEGDQLSSLLDDFDKKLGDDPLDDEFDVDPDLLPDLNDYERPTPTDAELFGPAPMGSFVPPGKKEIVRKPLTLPPRTPRQVVIPSVVTPKTPTRPLPVFPQQGGSTCPPGGKTPCQGSATPCPPPTNRAATAGGGFF